MTIHANDSASHAVSITSLQKIVDYIEENITEPLTPAAIAGHFFLSASSINNMFRIVCDIAIMEYIRNRRLTLAGLELLESDIRIIDLAYKYRYETPESFTKAFARFHGFPPGIVRRVYPAVKIFHPFQIRVEIQGGWDNMYDLIKLKGGTEMEANAKTHTISTRDMKQKEDWRILLTLAAKLDAEGIAFKVDGKTMIFAHGLDFKLEKICLTFKWNEEQKILDFFGHKGMSDKSFHPGFKYFDAMFAGMKIRCMFYNDGSCDDTDDSLYRNTDLVRVDGQTLHVQTVEFYLENTEPKNKDVFYQKVTRWAKGRA